MDPVAEEGVERVCGGVEGAVGPDECAGPDCDGDGGEESAGVIDVYLGAESGDFSWVEVGSEMWE